MSQHKSPRAVLWIPGLLSRNGLTSSSEQTREGMSWARTPGTRARIRRWARIETVGMMLILTGIVLLLLAPFASIALAIWSSISGVSHAGPHWWIWGTTIGVPAVGLTANLVATGRRQAACFADGQVCEGTVDRAIEHPGSGDDHTWYDLRISAALPDGVTLRRRLHLEGHRWDQRVGRSVRFRHNTLGPEDLDDVMLVGWPGADGRRS
ncbi:hypothetical protein [Streptomyces sp. NPDC050560]|uniref:hypothetical protein n=1 Tax=Streptomyces sp. NPDC050560 TaxID=3365630 RepID=UPI003791FE8C